MSPRQRTLLLSLVVLCAGATLWAGVSRRSATIRPLPPLGSHQVLTPRVTPGNRLELFHHGAPHPVRAVLTSGDQSWIGTAAAGLLRYDRRLWSDTARARPTLTLDVQRGLPSVTVNDLLLTPRGNLLVATSRGLALVDRRGRVRQTLLRDVAVTALAPGLVGTGQGLYSLRGEAVGCSPVPGFERIPIARLRRCGDWSYIAGEGSTLAVHSSGWIEPVALPPVVDLSGCHQDSLVAATLSGLYQLTGAVVRPMEVWERHATAVAVQPDGSILFGTYGDGGLRYVEGQTRLERVLGRGRVSVVHPAHGRKGRRPAARRSGATNIADATLVANESGLFVVRGAVAIRVPLDGPPRGVVTALAQQDKSLWVGTFDAGVAVMGPDGDWTRVPVHDDRITSLQLGPRGRMWIGTASGLARETEQGSRRVVRVRDGREWLSRHISVLRQHKGRLWIGAHPGLVTIAIDDGGQLSFEYRGAAGHQADSGLAGPTVYGVAFNRSGTWAGTEDGLSLHGSMLGEVHVLTDLDGRLPDNWITDVRTAADNTVNILTLRSGLLQIGAVGSRLLRTSLMTSPSAMQTIEHQVLFGTNRLGLALAGPMSRIRTFGPEQGLASAAVAALVYDRSVDRLWIGGDAGVDRLDQAMRQLK